MPVAMNIGPLSPGPLKELSDEMRTLLSKKNFPACNYINIATLTKAEMVTKVLMY